jgi:DNA polymerase elongation subunit (family B)
MIRTVVKKNESNIKLYVREITCVRTKKYEHRLFLFGNTENGTSTCVEILDFQPYVFIDTPDVQDLHAWISSLNESIRPWADFPDIITGFEICTKVPLIGFTNNEKKQFIKLEYRTVGDIWKIKKLFESPIDNGQDFEQIGLYHSDWSIESLFMHRMNIKLQSWVQIKGKQAFPRMSVCQLDLRVEMTNISPIISNRVPELLCCAIRLRTSKNSSVLLISMAYYWFGRKYAPPVIINLHGGNEGALLRDFDKTLRTHDPDCFIVLSDNKDPLTHLMTRLPTLNLSKLHHIFEHLRYGRDGMIFGINHSGRTVMNIQDALKKLMIEPKLDGFTLLDAVFHPKITRDTPSEEIRTYGYIIDGKLTSMEIAQCQHESELLVTIDLDSSMLMGYIELSAASFTSVTDTVSKGQQRRVWNKLISKFHEESILVNKDRLLQPPLIILKKASDSTYPSPPDIPNKPVVRVQQNKGRVQMDLFGRQVVKKTSKTAKKYSGGFVCTPEKGFHDKTPTFTFDFASLYPSIIQGYNICYMTIIYDRKYLEDDRCKKAYVPINEEECAVIAVAYDGLPVRGILPQAINEVCDERKKTKGLMKVTKDRFELSRLDAKQLGCKVFQNAVYGFLGVEKNGLLACPVLMAITCRIGQYMIKQVRYNMILKHSAFIVYGDTDSVMVQLPDVDVSRLDKANERCKSIASELTKLFNEPNELEFEAMKFPFWVSLAKKNYFALEYPVNSLTGNPSVVVKGLGFKKRDRCMFVREIGYRIVAYILHHSSDGILGFLESRLNDLVQGSVPIEQLSISCLLKSDSEYKNNNVIHVATADKIEKRTGKRPASGCRMSFVVLDGDAQLYLRGEDPDYVKEHKLNIDVSYYLNNQLKMSILPLMEFTGIDMLPLIRKYDGKYNAKRTNNQTIISMLGKRKI